MLQVVSVLTPIISCGSYVINATCQLGLKDLSDVMISNICYGDSESDYCRLLVTT